MYNSEPQALQCDSSKMCSPRGAMDRIDDEIMRIEDRLAKLRAFKDRASKLPEVRDLLNDISKLI